MGITYKLPSLIKEIRTLLKSSKHRANAVPHLSLKNGNKKWGGGSYNLDIGDYECEKKFFFKFHPTHPQSLEKSTKNFGGVGVPRF